MRQVVSAVSRKLLWLVWLLAGMSILLASCRLDGPTVRYLADRLASVRHADPYAKAASNLDLAERQIQWFSEQALKLDVDPSAGEGERELMHAALLGSSDVLLAVASEDGRVVGYVLAFDHPAFYANGRVAWVEEIMVSDEVRRRGVGRQLMAHVETWAKSRNAKLIALATRRAAPFYRSLGYDESAAYFRRLL